LAAGETEALRQSIKTLQSELNEVMRTSEGLEMEKQRLERENEFLDYSSEDRLKQKENEIKELKGRVDELEQYCSELCANLEKWTAAYETKMVVEGGIC